MAEILQLRDRSALAEYFSRNRCLHFYSLGDLDDFFWPYTSFFGLESRAGLDKVVAIYKGGALPVLLALAEPGDLDQGYIQDLLPFLPEELYAHLSPNLQEYFSGCCTIKDHGQHVKMALSEPGKLISQGLENTCHLSLDDLPELKVLYEVSYPENAFEPRTLASGHYYGYRENNRLLCAGGVHVFSQTYQVAALGNITTHPQFRNRGLAKAVTVRLCLSLLDCVDLIGLNVKADNQSAVRLYQSLGFRICANYGEFSLQKAIETDKNSSKSQ